MGRTVTPSEYFTRYLAFAGKGEISPSLHRWGAISAAAVLLSRRVYLKYGHGKIFPNFYIIYMGESASRKSTAVDHVRRILQAVDFSRFAPSETSKGKFAMHLAGLEDSVAGPRKKKSLDDVLNELDKTDRKAVISESFICAGELSTFLGLANYDFAAFLGDIWDKDSTYEVSFKQAGEFVIYNPLVNILAGNNFEGMMKVLPPEMLGQGFLSRCIFVYAPVSKTRIAFPTVDSTEMPVELLSDLAHFKMVSGEVTLDESALHLLEGIYNAWPGIQDHRFKPYSGRRFQHLLRLCIIEAIAARRMTVLSADVLRANTWLTFTEAYMPRALGEYGAGRNAMGANALMNIFYADPLRPWSVDQLWQKTSSAFDTQQGFSIAIAGLISSRKVIHEGLHLRLHLRTLPEDKYVNYGLFPEFIRKGDLV